MVKKALLLLAATSFFGVANAQLQCRTDEVYNNMKQAHPEIAVYEAQLKADIDAQLRHMNLAKFKTTGPDYLFNDTTQLHVPLVFHIIHNYGSEYVSDNAVYTALKEINDMYSRSNPDTGSIIAPFNRNIPGTNIKYAHNSHITFHLPTIDPSGNPTHGITRRRSYLTTNGGEESKLDIWPPDSYVNIWIINAFGAANAGAGAYALLPSGAAADPYGDGVIAIVQGGNINYDYTLAHELGHVFNLHHPWGDASGISQTGPYPPCGGDDFVDDTPPTHGHYLAPSGCVAANLYDTTCATNFSIIYDSLTAHNLFGIVTNNPSITINYPDTTNSQNTMDYTFCSKMFTYLQTVRMRAAARNTVANRNNLISASNLTATGALLPKLDLAPKADFFVNGNSTNPNMFVLPNTQTVTFINESWNDTLSSALWTFSNGATTATSTSTGSVVNKFSTPGWVTVSLKAVSNAGSDSIVNTKALYVADPNGISPVGYFEEFNQGGDLDKYPIFNYFNNSYKWEVVNNAGYYDNTSIRYNNFDSRTYPASLTNTPIGDYDDFFTPAFDLTKLGSGTNYLSFYSAGAFATNLSTDMNDVFEIAYSTTGTSWTLLKSFTKGQIGNNGVQITPFTPAGYWQWVGQDVALPSSILSSNAVYFRFRFKPGGTSTTLMGTGNHFYIDRIHISPYTTSVSELENQNVGIALAPNPTTGSSSILIKDAKSATAHIQVTDITGKIVYTTTANLNGSLTSIEIPANYISAKGMYLVQVTTGSVKRTEKLVVY